MLISKYKKSNKREKSISKLCLAALITLIFIDIINLANDNAYANTQAKTKVYYVSTCGDDSWSGTKASPDKDLQDGPFLTIEKARDQIRLDRKLGQTYKYIVFLRGGIFKLGNTLTFGLEDSGTSDALICYMAFKKEIPIISGGVQIAGNWKKSKENKMLYECYIPTVQSGDWYFKNLFVNGSRRRRTRWPKEGHLRIKKLLTGAVLKSKSDQIAKAGYVYNENDFDPNWSNISDIDVITLQMWTAPRRHLKTIDPETNEIEFFYKVFWPFGYWGLNYYYCENVYEKIGPGEWYLDRKNGKLTYFPLPGEDIAKLGFIAPKSSMNLVEFTADSKFIQLAGLAFAYSDYNLTNKDTRYLKDGIGILISGQNIIIENCHIKQVGSYGILMQPKSSNNIIKNCSIDDVCGGGIKMAGGNSIVLNNLISNGGIIDYGEIAISTGSGGNEVINNEIFNFPYIGISCGGKNVHIKRNNVHDVMQILSDGAGIYIGPSPGLVKIEENMVHHIGYSSLLKIGNYGIYLDDGVHNVTVKNNIVYKTISACLHLNHGHSNVIQNNIFAFSEKEGLIKRSAWRKGETIGWSVERNIFINDGKTAVKSEMIASKNTDRKYKFDNNIYFAKQKKPSFHGMTFEEWQKTRESTLFGAKWDENGQIRPDRVAAGKFIGGRWVDLEFQDQHSIVADPLVKDIDKFDFALLPNSPALKLGFHPIDVSRIGRQKKMDKYNVD